MKFSAGTAFKMIPADQIRPHPLYRLSPDWFCRRGLRASVKQSGVLAPLLIFRFDDQLQLARGYQRFRAAKAEGVSEVPVLIQESAIRDHLDFYRETILENASFRDFHEIEKATILRTLRDDFRVEEAEIIRKDLPLLGIRPNRFTLLLYLKLSRLPRPLQEAASDLGVEAVARLESWDPADQLFLLDRLQSYQPGRNHQKQFLGLLEELLQKGAKQAEHRLADLWSELGAYAIEQREGLSPQDRFELLLRALRDARYPTLAQMEATANQLKSALRLPPEIQLNWPRFFEGDRMQVQLGFRSPEELRHSAERLAEIAVKPELKRLFELL